MVGIALNVEILVLIMIAMDVVTIIYTGKDKESGNGRSVGNVNVGNKSNENERLSVCAMNEIVKGTNEIGMMLIVIITMIMTNHIKVPLVRYIKNQR